MQNNYGYLVAKDNLLITLIPGNVNDEHRTVVDPALAQFSCSEATIVYICDRLTGLSHNQANIQMNMGKPDLAVKTGETVTDPLYKNNIPYRSYSYRCPHGITYFRTQDAAIMYYMNHTQNYDNYTGTARASNEMGEVWKEIPYLNGKKQGPFKTYYNYKKLPIYVQGQFDNDQLNGPFKQYHENGQLMTQGIYENGKRTGKWVWFDKKGITTQTENL